MLPVISYAKKYVDPRGCVHSIDNLVIEYICHFGTSSSVLDALARDVFEPCSLENWSFDNNTLDNLKGCSKYDFFRSAIWGGGFYIQYGHYQNFDKVSREWTLAPVLRIKFNPNKCWETELFARLSGWVARECENGVLLKLDYAVDIPAPPASVVVRSRKRYSYINGTRYYGQRNRHGRLKVYDKRIESSLDRDLTRVEWTLSFNHPLVFDDVLWLTQGPAPLPDSSELSPQTRTIALLLLDIRAAGGDVLASLGRLDSRTAKKVEPYTLGEGVQLLSDSLRFTSLVDSYCHDLSLSFVCGGVNGFSIGSSILGSHCFSDEDGDELPF